MKQKCNFSLILIAAVMVALTSGCITRHEKTTYLRADGSAQSVVHKFSNEPYQVPTNKTVIIIVKSTGLNVSMNQVSQTPEITIGQKVAELISMPPGSVLPPLRILAGVKADVGGGGINDSLETGDAVRGTNAGAGGFLGEAVKVFPVPVSKGK